MIGNKPLKKKKSLPPKKNFKLSLSFRKQKPPKNLLKTSARTIFCKRKFLNKNMGLFSVNYQNVPGQCVYAKGGLKFRADEDKLRHYFSPILPRISLNDIIGEAVFWSMLPSALAIWIFPILLYFKGILFALIATLILYLITEIGHLIFYLKPLNYIVFILGNNFLAFIIYLIWAMMLIRSGSKEEVIVLGVWFLFFAFGLGQLILLPLLPILTKFFALPPSDQILRNVGWYYARKFGLDPTKWRMSDEVNDEKQNKEFDERKN